MTEHETIRSVEAVRAWLESDPVWQQAADYLARQPAPAYLVGGSVRDALLGRPGYDMDIAVDGPAMGMARRLADLLHGAYVPLDRERDVARVVLHHAKSPQTTHYIDLAGLRAKGIIGDLLARDFTINALAVPLQHGAHEILDPTGGLADLHAGRLRAANDRAFIDDPLRVLRLVRLKGALGFTVQPDTFELARQAAPRLRAVSPERVRDELFNILKLTHATVAVGEAHHLGALAIVLAPLIVADDALSRGIEHLGAVEHLAGGWLSEPLVRAQGPGALLAYLQPLRAHWRQELSSGRTRWQCHKLAALLSALNDVDELVLGESLRLSVHERRFVVNCLRGLARRDLWCAKDVDDLAIYRYYRAVGGAGVDAAVLALAIHDSPYLPGLVGRLLWAWFDAHERLVDPPPLLTGRDLMAALDIEPGPRVGELLESAREAQVQGLVTTPDEAKAYLRERV